MRTREITVRIILGVVGAVALILSVPAAQSGWHTNSKTVTESYIAAGGVDDGSRMYGDYCTSDTVLDGGTQCYASSYEEPTTWRDRLDLAFGRGVLPFAGGIILLALAFRSRRKNEESLKPAMA